MSNFVALDHLCRSVTLSNLMMTLDQDSAFGCPEKVCNFGGNGDNGLSDDGDAEAFPPFLPFFVLDLSLDLACSFPVERSVPLAPLYVKGLSFLRPRITSSEAPAEPFPVYILSLAKLSLSFLKSH